MVTFLLNTKDLITKKIFDMEHLMLVIFVIFSIAEFYAVTKLFNLPAALPIFLFVLNSIIGYTIYHYEISGIYGVISIMFFFQAGVNINLYKTMQHRRKKN